MAHNYKPARRWADEIAQLPTRAARKEALTTVPGNLRPIVETHLRNLWEQKKFQAAQLAFDQGIE